MHRRLHRASIAARSLPALLTVALAVTGVGWAGSAVADPIQHCTTSGWIYSSLTTQVTSHRSVLTHLHGLHLSPGSSVNKTVTLQHTTTVSASASLTTEVSASVGNKIIGSADLKVSGTLATSGQHTSSRSESVSQHFSAGSKDRYFAVYDGAVAYAGTWHMDKCSNKIRVSFSGRWKSYVNVSDSNALCRLGTTSRKSAYSKGSLSYQGCTALGWGSAM